MEEGEAKRRQREERGLRDERNIIHFNKLVATYSSNLYSKRYGVKVRPLCGLQFILLHELVTNFDFVKQPVFSKPVLTSYYTSLYLYGKIHLANFHWHKPICTFFTALIVRI